MSDPVTLARNARENFARGLAALQAPGVPAEVMSVAEPIARAMGALHQIEASQGASLPQQAPLALEAARAALQQLQAKMGVHGAVDQAIEAVAGSLSSVHVLSQMQPPAAQPGAGHTPQARAELGVQETHFAGGAIPAAAQQAAANYVQPAPAHVPAPPQAYAEPRVPETVSYPPDANGVVRVEAALGAHSSTNFFKGLSGNDVVDSGGIFIATYQIPDIGQPLAIKVSMPGGYEFEARGVVSWTRDVPASSTGPESPPGFGAKFTQISAEGRQLVYRYVRNREPLFHDDL